MRLLVGSLRFAWGILVWGPLAALPSAAGADTASAGFQVAVRLAPASLTGVCVSESLSVKTLAVFEVTCGSGHFVSMSPQPGRPFVGTHGSAFRFHALPPSRGVLPALLTARHPQTDALPEVAMLRVSSGRPTFDGQLEILVSF